MKTYLHVAAEEDDDEEDHEPHEADPLEAVEDEPRPEEEFVLRDDRPDEQRVGKDEDDVQGDGDRHEIGGPLKKHHFSIIQFIHFI